MVMAHGSGLVVQNRNWSFDIVIVFVYSPSILPLRIAANGSNVNSMIFCVPLEFANVDDPDFEPVKKVPVIVSGDEGSVFIEVVDS